MANDPILVVVFLRGGADGLMLVSPASDPDFLAARPEALRVARQGDAAGRLIAQDVAEGEFRFHPGLAAFADLYEAGDLSLVHASGLTDATRSHFDAEARIEQGLLGAALPPGDPGGWIGRWLAEARPGGPMPALAVGAMRPASLIGAKAAIAERLEDLLIGAGHWLAPQLRARLMAGFGDHALLGLPMAELIALNDALSPMLWNADAGEARLYAPDHPYPEANPLSQPLMTVAQAIKSGLGLRVATVDAPGWDTHVNQTLQIDRLTRGLGDAVMAFWRDLGSLQQDVCVVVMSEFGRRLRSNSAGGTDHGRGNVMMVLGPQSRGGRMVGTWPGLAHDALEEGADLAVVTDYRTVLGELLSGHMGLADASRVFPGFRAPAPIGLWS